METQKIQNYHSFLKKFQKLHQPFRAKNWKDDPWT